jgi:hypothetical protein
MNRLLGCTAQPLRQAAAATMCLIAESANTPTNFEFSQKSLQCGVLVNFIGDLYGQRVIIDVDER